jgi:Endoplasmic reticulum protein ERp29, C-terminal domain
LLQQRPQMQAFKDLVEDFLRVDDAGRAAKLAEGNRLLADLEEGQKCEGDECAPTSPMLIHSAKYYTTVMQRIVDKGLDFVEKEMDRIDVLVDSPNTPAKKKSEFRVRLGCLDDFRYELADKTPKLGVHFQDKNKKK